MKKRLTIVFSLAAALLMAFCLIACGKTNVDQGTNGGDDATVASSVSITNKTALTDNWYVGMPERKVEYKVPDGATAVVTSSNAAAVRVNGENIEAVGAGSAVITVTGGRRSDSVEITVRSAADAVNITNKRELAAAWTLGEGTRSVELAPAVEGEQHVTTSDADVVEVSGKTLTAKKAGTARITVTVGEFSDAVNITVRPVLESITIVNKTALTSGNWVVGDDGAINLDFVPSLYYSRANTDIEITSSNPAAVKVDGFGLKAVGKGSALITVKSGNVTDTMTLNVVTGKPIVDIDGDSIVEADAHEFTLPAVTAKMADGTSLNVSTKLSDDGKMTYDRATRKLTVSQNGEYTVTYTAVDPADAQNRTSKTVTVRAYRNIVKTVVGNTLAPQIRYVEGKQFVDDDKQALTSDIGEIIMAQFNIAPSTQYYAEATFDITTPGANVYVGMTHSAEKSANELEPREWLASFSDRGPAANQRNFKSKHITVGAENAFTLGGEGNDNSNIMCLYQLGRFHDIDLNIKKVKYAVVRNGDFFYTFINDKYVMGCTDAKFGGVPTIPGIFGQQFNTANGGVTVSAISYTTSLDKFNTITNNGQKLVRQSGSVSDRAMNDDGSFVEFSGTHPGTKDGRVTYNQNGTISVTSYGYTANTDGGKSMWSDKNNTILSSYMFFDGDFALQWDYKNIDSHGNGNFGLRGGMFVEFVSRKGELSGNEDGKQAGVVFGGIYYNNATRIVAGKSSDNDKNSDGTDPRNTLTINNNASSGALESMDQSQGITFKVTRKLDAANKKAVMTFTVTSKAQPTQTYSSTQEITENWWNAPIYPRWQNKFVKGEYSNISWSASVAA